MRILKTIFSLLFVLLIIEANSQSSKFNSISKKIVNTTLQVQPGETVVISGTVPELKIMEELYVEVAKAGGKPTMEIIVPKANKRAIMESHIDFLKIPDTYYLFKIRAVDCFINVTSVQDPDLLSDVPEEKLAFVRQSNQLVNKQLRNASFRSVTLGQVGGIPTIAYSESFGAKYDDMINMFWNAVDTDYDALLKKGMDVTKALVSGSTAILTTPSGTNLTFKIGDSGARTNCGRNDETIGNRGPSNTWLPAGEAYVSIDPSSANGTLVVPSLRFRNIQIDNLKLTFRYGQLISLKASTNEEVLKKALQLATGMKDVLSLLDIGINPQSKPINGSDYLSYEMGGIITLGIGNNLWAGGKIDSDFGTEFHLKEASLKVDGKDIVVSGILQ